MALLEIPETREVNQPSEMALVHWCRFLKRQIFIHARAVALQEISEVSQNDYLDGYLEYYLKSLGLRLVLCGGCPGPPPPTPGQVSIN
jgi:hypothetical protein